jgi:hypothetical protein
MLGLLPCAGFFVVVLVASFLPSFRGLGFLLFEVGAGAPLQSQWRVLGLYALRVQAS